MFINDNFDKFDEQDQVLDGSDKNYDDDNDE